MVLFIIVTFSLGSVLLERPEWAYIYCIKLDITIIYKLIMDQSKLY